MSYGLPYMGSKNTIAEWVISKIPKTENLYDLFCGGCAITHAALLTNKFKHIHANDLNPNSKLFIDAVNGKYHDEKRWISREDFERLKDKEPYVAFVWSFGNNQDNYLYSKEIEQWKKALHYARVYRDYSLFEEFGIKTKGTRKYIVKHKEEFKKAYIKWYLKKFHNKYAGILQSLESLESLQSLEFTNKSYDEVEIKENSVIYCDIPYKNTTSYTIGEFDHEKFYTWAKNQKQLVIISEYSMPEDFTCIAQREKRCTLSATTNTKAIEKLFVPNNQLDLYKKRQNGH